MTDPSALRRLVAKVTNGEPISNAEFGTLYALSTVRDLLDTIERLEKNQRTVGTVDVCARNNIDGCLLLPARIIWL